MHICFLCDEYPPGLHGGIGSVTQTLAHALVRRGHTVTVLGVSKAHPAGEIDDDGVRVIRLPHALVARTGFLVNGYRRRAVLKRIQKEHAIDVLEGPESSLAVMPRFFPVPRAIRMHGGHHFFARTLGKAPTPWRGWLERRSFQRADYLCAVSKFVGETTRRLLRLGDRPIETLLNPIDTSRFAPMPGVPEEEGLIVFVGTVCEKKGVRQLVEAMGRIVEAVPTAHLLIVGRDWRDPESGTSFTEKLRGSIPHGIESKVVFRGPVAQEDLPQILARASMCVYPSHMEALPIAWLEGLAMGKAVVAASTGPGPEVIEDGISGLLCDPHDPGSIAERVILALRDEPMRKRLGAEARRRAVDRFSVEPLVDRNLKFYARCIRDWNART
jgi:glycosyltransferase involved in cell wall biosynthesis